MHINSNHLYIFTKSFFIGNASYFLDEMLRKHFIQSFTNHLNHYKIMIKALLLLILAVALVQAIHFERTDINNGWAMNILRGPVSSE